MTARTPEDRAREIVDDVRALSGTCYCRDVPNQASADYECPRCFLLRSISAALSADPVAEAAIRLAEVVDERSFFQYARVYRGERVVWACHFCGGSGDAPRLIEHEDGCALAKYRQAREGRGK